MSVKNNTASSAAIDAVLADNAELRSQLALLAAAIAEQNKGIATLASAALAPKTRSVRAVSAPATVTEADRVCNTGGFRRGYRAKAVRNLVGFGTGVRTLADLTEAVAPGYPVRSMLPVVEAIARRLSRIPACGYTLIVDKDEGDFGKTELEFRTRDAADPVITGKDTDEAAE